MGANDYSTILACPRIDQMNIQIYWDAKGLPESISEYIWSEESHKYGY